jgi:hypothetical protein
MMTAQAVCGQTFGADERMNDSCLLSFIPKGYVDVTNETSLG